MKLLTGINFVMFLSPITAARWSQGLRSVFVSCACLCVFVVQSCPNTVSWHLGYQTFSEELCKNTYITLRLHYVKIFLLLIVTVCQSRIDFFLEVFEHFLPQTIFANISFQPLHTVSVVSTKGFRCITKWDVAPDPCVLFACSQMRLNFVHKFLLYSFPFNGILEKKLIGGKFGNKSIFGWFLNCFYNCWYFTCVVEQL